MAFDLFKNIDNEKIKKIRQNLGDFIGLLTKVVCLFDDIPFLLLEAAENLGMFLLAGAGFIIFPFQLLEGSLELAEAIEKDKKKCPQRPALIGLAIGQIICAVAGLASTAALLACTLTGMAVVAEILAVSVPGIIAVVAGIELAEKVVGLVYAKEAAKKEKLKIKVFYGSVFFGIALTITALAALSVVSSLGVLSLGIVPSAILIGIVAAAFLLKVFELVDSRNMNYAMTKWVRGLFTRPDNDLVVEKTLTPDFTPSNQKIYEQIGTPSSEAPKADVKSEAEIEVELSETRSCNDAHISLEVESSDSSDTLEKSDEQSLSHSM
jgi:hypothetical protein